MADVKLILRADNTQYVNSVKQAQQATENLHNTSEKGMRREKGLIEDVENELTRLQEKKRKAWTVKDIEAYNKKIAEAKVHLKEYETAGVQANEKIEKSGNRMMGVMAGWAAAIGTVTAAFRVLKDAVLETETGLNRFNIVGAVTKQLLYDIIHRTDWKLWKKNMQDVATIQEHLNTLRVIERDSLKEAKIYYNVFQRNLIDAKNQMASAEERLKSYDYALLALNKSVDIENENTATRLALVKEWLKTAPDNEKLLEEESQLTLKLIDIENRRWSRTQEINSMRTGIMKSMAKENQDAYDNELKALADYLEEQFKEYQGAYDDQLKELLKYHKDKKKAEDKAWEDSLDFARTIQKHQREEAKKAWDKRNEDEENAKKAEEELDKQRQQRIDAIKLGLTTLLEFTRSITDQELQDTQRRRELTDIRIAEVQREIDAETELKTAGFANNVAAKKKELEELKKQREKALRDEEESIKKQKQMEAISQGVNIFSSATQILKTYTKLGPIGLALAAGAVTAMFALLNSVKSRTETIKLAKGGSGTDTGMITGKKHSQGGERFLDKVEVERGESWGVLSVPATKKFGKIFHHMVNSFNRGEIPEITPVNKINNRVMVENNGPNSRLDKVINEQKELNKKLSSRESVTDYGNRMVIQRGSTITIIKR